MKNAKDTHKSRLKLWDSSIDSRQKWMDSTTGFFCEEFVESRNCPVCDSAHKLFMFNKEGGSYQKCENCSMVYLSPVFKDQYLTQHYQSNHSVQSEIVASDLAFYQRIYQFGLDMIQKNQTINNVLDIGCSSGVFLDMCKDIKLYTSGVELNESEAKVCSQNHTVYSCQLSDLNESLKFDLITMWDVFEHIKDGHSMLKEVSNKLNESGLLFLQIPNVGSLAATVLQELCNMFDGLEHVNLYDKDSVSHLASVCDFEVVDFSTVISEASVIGNYLNYEAPYQGSFEKNNSLFSDDFILANELGYKIQILLRKKPTA
jgi:2-polyprenyl-3-methyl-5-hydroxy-6-metoxy-1,4-benzoquinol methylase